MRWGYYVPACCRCAQDEELGSDDRAGEKRVSLLRNTCVRGKAGDRHVLCTATSRWSPAISQDSAAHLTGSPLRVTKVLLDVFLLPHSSSIT